MSADSDEASAHAQRFQKLPTEAAPKGLSGDAAVHPSPPPPHQGAGEDPNASAVASPTGTHVGKPATIGGTPEDAAGDDQSSQAHGTDTPSAHNPDAGGSPVSSPDAHPPIPPAPPVQNEQPASQSNSGAGNSTSVLHEEDDASVQGIPKGGTAAGAHHQQAPVLGRGRIVFALVAAVCLTLALGGVVYVVLRQRRLKRQGYADFGSLEMRRYAEWQQHAGL